MIEVQGRKSNRIRDANIFKITCCGNRLCGLHKNLSGNQRTAVVEIGFGSLLDLKITWNNNSLSQLLVERSNGGSGMFRVAYGKEFKINQYDVHDVFQFPLHEGNVVVNVSRGANVDNSHLKLKASWIEYFGVYHEKGQIPMPLVFPE